MNQKVVIDCQEISELRDISKYIQAAKAPVIFKGDWKKWMVFSEWDIDDLYDVYESTNVIVEKSRLSHVPELSDEYCKARSYERESFIDAINGLQNEGLKYGGAITNTPIPNELANVLGTNKQLHEIVGFPRFVPSGVKKQFTRPLGLWVCPEGVKTPLHFDRHENLNLQVKGSKRWKTVSPRNSKLLRQEAPQDLPLIYSMVSLFDGDKYPLELGSDAVIDVTLQEGEMLYLPPGWWHCVETLEDSINANFWWTSKTSVGHPRMPSDR